MHTRSGKLPLILRIHPAKVGERAWIWCRAGICAGDFEAHTGEIRAACYARDTRVNHSTRWSHLVTVDIIRRDPLSTGTHIPSPLRHHGTPPVTPAAAGRGMTGTKIILDWRHARIGPPDPCVLCGRPALLRSPGKQVPCHKTCAENWHAAHPSHSPQQARLAA
jgi:hypothetical protein